MKLRILSLSILIILYSCYPTRSAEEEITKVLMEQQSSWNQGDIPGFMNHYFDSEELTFAGASGVTRGHQKVLERYLKNYDSPEKMGELTFNILDFHELSDESAFVIGEWALKREGDNPSGYFTLVWKKVNGEWKIIHDHTS
ncbi:MAG: nuclear transport factor 2 family protein [Bacteroidota bacterium]